MSKITLKKYYLKFFSKIFAYLNIFTLTITCFSTICIASTNNDDTHEFFLKNGLKLIVKENHRAPLVISQVWYKIGSSYETKGITGISHMLEHMMFKGKTNKVKNGFLQEFSELGGEQNAGTSLDYTFYYQKVKSEFLEKCFELEADRMENLTLNNKDFLSERDVVAEERRQSYEVNPHKILLERFWSTLQLGSPYDHFPIGWMQDIQSFNLNNVKNWYSTYYVPNNAVIVVVGDVKPKNVYNLCKRYFANIKAKKLPERKNFKFLDNIGKREISVKIPAKTDEIIIGYNVPSFVTTKEKREPFALIVAINALAQGKTSRLYKDLVLNKKVASSISGSYYPKMLYDSPIVFTAIPAENVSLSDLEKEIFLQINNLKKKYLSKKELEKIKTKVIANDLYKKDSLWNTAYQIGNLEAIGLSWKDENDFIKNIEAITKEQVQEVAKLYFNENNVVIARLFADRID